MQTYERPMNENNHLNYISLTPVYGKYSFLQIYINIY